MVRRAAADVEINNTFYQMPKETTLEHWAEVTPQAFRFAIKASQRITHIGRLKADKVTEPVAYLYDRLGALGAKRGPVLFQLPPNMKKDLPRLVEFLGLLPQDHRAVFEFRHDSWFDDDVYAALQTAGAALYSGSTDFSGMKATISIAGLLASSSAFSSSAVNSTKRSFSNS